MIKNIYNIYFINIIIICFIKYIYLKLDYANRKLELRFLNSEKLCLKSKEKIIISIYQKLTEI